MSRQSNAQRRQRRFSMSPESMTGLCLACAFGLGIALGLPEDAAAACKHGDRHYATGQKIMLYGREHVCNRNGLWQYTSQPQPREGQENKCYFGSSSYETRDRICNEGTPYYCGANGAWTPIPDQTC